jgi:hypothetical protein
LNDFLKNKWMWASLIGPSPQKEALALWTLPKKSLCNFSPWSSNFGYKGKISAKDIGKKCGAIGNTLRT